MVFPSRYFQPDTWSHELSLRSRSHNHLELQGTRMEEDDILFGCHRGVATVTLNRPLALNAFSPDHSVRPDGAEHQWRKVPSPSPTRTVS
jgi:hypothetical protein